MSELRFDGRVAVVTGAGRNLGRAYARLLASRGAKVVVNDPGVQVDGEGFDAGPAESVVAEIEADGGEAIASLDSVATPEGGQAIVDAAIDRYGRIDILIHNAGNVRRAPLTEMTVEQFRGVLDVHLIGAFHVVRAAFPAMCEARYGRIVLTSSVVGMYGNARVANYSVSKAGMMGLSNVAALEGAEHGITSNMILPGASGRMGEGSKIAGRTKTVDSAITSVMTADTVAPTVAWLCHESCDATGEMFISMAGRVARAFVAETRGVSLREWTPESVAANIDEIRNIGEPIVFPPVPTGVGDHVMFSRSLLTTSEPS